MDVGHHKKSPHLCTGSLMAAEVKHMGVQHFGGSYVLIVVQVVALLLIAALVSWRCHGTAVVTLSPDIRCNTFLLNTSVGISDPCFSFF